MKRRALLGALGAAACVPAALAGQALSGQPFVMAMIRPENQFLGRWQRLIYREAFSRLGLEISFVDYPAARASVELDRGTVDGEGGRPPAYAGSSAHIVRLPVPLFEVSYVAYGRRDRKPQSLNSWNSLRRFNGVVAYKAGVHTTRTELPLVLPSNRLIAVTGADRGLQMLALGRCDLYVDEELAILTELSRPAMAELPVARAGLLAPVEVFGYLHERHAPLAGRLGQVIAQMARQGEIERYRRKTESEFAIDAARWLG